MTLKEAYRQGRQRLARSGSELPDLDARLLLAHASGLKPDQIILNPDRALSREAEDIFRKCIGRRAASEPVAYILGQRDFYKHTFRVTPDVLIPRPETEHLIEAVLKFFPKTESLLDIGTGSGIIPITLKDELPKLKRCVAADISEAALCVAKMNAAAILGKEHGIDFIQSDIFTAVSGRYDLIVSNPPYVTLGEYEDVKPDVRDYEPQLALTAGAEGMDCYSRIIRGAADHLEGGGGLVLEVSDATADKCATLATERGFNVKEIIRDYSGHLRVLVGVLT